jgi:hypothetical protein
MSPKSVVARGQLTVNLPVVCILAFGIFGAIATSGWRSVLSATAGFVFAWLWWSVSVPRWRRWAEKTGVDARQVYRLAVYTGLIWPEGSLFEKTELAPRHKTSESQDSPE